MSASIGISVHFADVWGSLYGTGTDIFLIEVTLSMRNRKDYYLIKNNSENLVW